MSDIEEDLERQKYLEKSRKLQTVVMTFFALVIIAIFCPAILVFAIPAILLGIFMLVLKLLWAIAKRIFNKFFNS